MQTVLDVGAGKMTGLETAVTYNYKIWTILVTCALRGENALPQPIRQSIAELGLYVIRQTASLLRRRDMKPGRDELAILIEINRSVAVGLRAG